MPSLKEYNRKYYLENREKAIEYAKRYRVENPEKYRENIKKWQKEHPEKIKEYSKKKYQKNKEAHKARQKKTEPIWRNKNRDNIANRVLNKKYGISLEEYNSILKKQGGKCKICGSEKPWNGNRKYSRFCVDHNHKTGEVRGLLCGLCNLMIGYARDDGNILLNAIAYLKKDK